MKRISAKMIFISAGTAICVFALHSCWVRMHAVERFVCTFDEKLSQEIQQQISASLSKHMGESAPEIISSLTAEFPCIAHVKLHIQPNKDALVAVQAQTPLLRMNDAYVLTQNAQALQAHYFDPQIISNLSQMQAAPDVLSDAQALLELKNHVKDIEPSIFQDFNLTWRQLNEVVLEDKNNSLVHYVCCAHQLSDKTRIKIYVDQVTQLMVDRMANSPSKKQLIADLRFENQLILRGSAVGKNVTNGSKGGTQHGTRIS